MISMRLKSKKLKKLNDKGSALIVCILVLLFVSILATMILYMSGINFRMKASEYRTRVSFYEAEKPLERMQGNLVVPVSEALDIAYRRTNNRYTDLADADSRRQYFYEQFEAEFKKLLKEQYGGATIGAAGGGAAITDSVLIKNIIHNLTFNDTDVVPDSGVPLNHIFCNDAITKNAPYGISYVDYSADPLVFIEALEEASLLPGSDVTEVYIVVPDMLDQGSADDNMNNFVVQSYKDDASGDLFEAKECRVLIKNVCVVVVHKNGYRSIVTTDIAIQMPPLEWSTPGSSVDYKNWDVYQLIYYINWRKN